MENYIKQAEDFLQEHDIKFTVKFIKYAPHFTGEKDSRDIYRATFTREGKRFSLRFGQSIAESTGNGSKKPSAYDVLACIQKYDVGSFEDFCGDFGYDTDSRKAEKIYKAVLKEYKKVSEFFTDEEITELQDIQ